MIDTAYNRSCHADCGNRLRTVGAQNEANGDYNSFQLSFRGTALNNDLTFQVGYTYSHTNDSFDGIMESDGDLSLISNPTEDGSMISDLLHSTSGVIFLLTSYIGFHC
jgi:hypothetical protein